MGRQCAPEQLFSEKLFENFFKRNFQAAKGDQRRLSQLGTSSNLAQAIAGSAPSAGFRSGRPSPLRRASSSSSFISLTALICRCSANTSPEYWCTHSSQWPWCHGWMGWAPNLFQAA